MKLNHIKNSITFLFLALFFSMKIAGIHALTHTDDEHEETCVVCDYVISHNLTPVLTPDSQEFEINTMELIIDVKIINEYSFSPTSNVIQGHLFSRPPPFLL